MSLGLFNCRLIQPAGDQLFFFAGCLASSGKLCSVSLCPILLGPDQREGAACFLFFLLRRVLFGFFKGGEAPVGCRRLPPIQLRIPTKILNPTHRFCYRALKKSKSEVTLESTNFYATNFELGAIPPLFIYQLSRSRWRIDAEVFQTITTDCHLKHPAVHQSTALVVLTMIRVLSYVLSLVFYQRQICSHARGPVSYTHLRAHETDS